MNQIYLALAKLFSFLSLSAFGGGNVIFPSIHQVAVNQYHWMTDRQFLDVFSISKAAPGPTTMLVELVGMKAVAFPGDGHFLFIPALIAAVVSILAIFIPSSVLLLFVVNAWKKIHGAPWQESIQKALMPITCGLILASTWIVARPAITGWITGFIALIGLYVIFYTKINPVLLMLVAGFMSWMIWK
ncbi:MAG: chromate transporter [Chthoniobacterales bacterium]